MLLVATKMGWLVSRTDSIVGVILGIGLVNKAANWNLMKPIALASVTALPAAAAIGTVGIMLLRAVFG